MRVISGKARGLKLESPYGLDTRPTLDRVKEAVFSMIMPQLMDADVLDLFAGSGALGIEALSRGAGQAVFVDSSQKAVDCITSNVKAAKFQAQSEIVCSDAVSYLKKTSAKFNIIFLDPPYAQELYLPVTKELANDDILCNDGIIVAEWDYENGTPLFEHSFVPIKEKRYGRVGITVLKRS